MDAEMAQEAEIRRSLSGSSRQCRGSKGTYPVLRKITLTGSTTLTLADISSNARRTCSHTYNLLRDNKRMKRKEIIQSDQQIIPNITFDHHIITITITITLCVSSPTQVIDLSAGHKSKHASPNMRRMTESKARKTTAHSKKRGSNKIQTPSEENYLKRIYLHAKTKGENAHKINTNKQKQILNSARNLNNYKFYPIADYEPRPITDTMSCVRNGDLSSSSCDGMD